MTTYSTLGFAAAERKQAGDYVAVGGEPRRIVAVKREGADWPMYKLAGVHGLVSMDGSGYVSWRFCGDTRVVGVDQFGHHGIQRLADMAAVRTPPSRATKGVEHATRYKALRFRWDGPLHNGCWRFVDVATGSSVGPQYANSAELLADADRYAEVFGA